MFQKQKDCFISSQEYSQSLPFLPQANTEILTHAFISTCLDFCNVLLSGLPKKTISNLHALQNSATRVLTKTRMQAHITPV